MPNETSTAIRRHNTGPGYDSPVPLRALEQGARFLSYADLSAAEGWHLPDVVETGTVLWVGQGSIEVWWDRGKEPTRCQPELPVYKLDEEAFDEDEIDQYYRLGGQEAEMTETGGTGTITNPTVKALVARFNFQLKTLQEALDGDDKAKASICMTRIQKAVMEARQLRIALPDVPSALAAYEPLIELLADDSAKRAAEAVERENADARKADQTARQTNRAVAMERHQTEAGAAKKSSGTPKPKAEKKMRPCLDGCGTMVPGNFAMGHDAKLKSLLLKIERGEQPLDAIPEPCLDLVKIQKGEAIQDRDAKGDPKGEPKQTFRIVAAPVKFPGRDDIQITHRDD